MTMYRWDMTLFDGMKRMVGGRFVLAADAEAAIAAARHQEAQVHAATERWSPLSHLQGQREALAAAVHRVEALPHALECVTRDPNHKRPCNCLRGDALDAIKGDQP